MIIKKSLHIYVFLATIIVGAILIAALGINRPISGFREPQAASTTRLYVEEGNIDLLYPKLNVMGYPGYFVLEFPVYQAIVASLWNIFSLNEIWGRIISFLFWILGGFYLYYLCLLFSDKRTALFAFFLFLFAPISIIYSNIIGIEAMSVSLSIMFLYYGSKWIIFNRLSYFFIALLICIIGFLQKLPNIALMFLPLVALKYAYGKKKISSIFSPLFMLLGLIPLVSALVWQHHADYVNSMHQASEWYTTAKLKHWYFGTIGQRLNPINYLLVTTRALEDSFGSIYAGVLLIIGLLSARKYYFFAFYLLGFLFSFLIFTNLHLPHRHYMLPFLAPMVFFGAVGAIRCWDCLKMPLIKLGKIEIKESWIKKLIILSAMMLFIMNTVRATEFRDTFHKNEDVILMGNIIRNHIPEDRRIMLYQQKQGWSALIMYLAHRRGVTVDLETLENEDIQKSMNNYDCHYLVLAGESLTALYKAGTRSRQIAYGKRDTCNDLEFSVTLTSNIEKKLSSLKLIYNSNRLRIYKR